MEKILTDIVKEKGISKIIMEYKKEFDNITFCSSCNKKFENEFYRIKKNSKIFNGNCCFHCKEKVLEAFFTANHWTRETNYDDFKKIFGRMKKYKMGRHLIWRRVKKKKYNPSQDYYKYIDDHLDDTDTDTDTDELFSNFTEIFNIE